MDIDERIDAAAEKVIDAFSDVIGKEFPEAKTGDFGPEETLALDRAVRRAIETWVYWNIQVKGLG